MKSGELPKLYSKQQVLARYDIKECALWRHMYEGRLPFLKVGKFVWFTDQHLRAFEKSCERKIAKVRPEKLS